ncbi:COMM domain-containing protein 4-like [Diadema antillarum]|uniref:COMM domain-containing protein 4-like n=1 Tax=Diadema antillarum TaxID=105358 RepID=UPI003A839413
MGVVRGGISSEGDGGIGVVVDKVSDDFDDDDTMTMITIAIVMTRLPPTVSSPSRFANSDFNATWHRTIPGAEKAFADSKGQNATAVKAMNTDDPGRIKLVFTSTGYYRKLLLVMTIKSAGGANIHHTLNSERPPARPGLAIPKMERSVPVTSQVQLCPCRFRFCGDLDCPDWVLAEISILSKITSIKMKQLCGQVIKDLLGEQIDYEKVYKLTADAKYEPGDVKASIAALTFILTSAAKYNVDGESLSNELQQLGLPKEHSTALSRSYGDKRDKMQEQLRSQSLRLSKFDSVDWRVDYILGSSEIQAINEPSLQLRLKLRNPDTDTMDVTSFSVSSDKFRILINELRQTLTLMEGLS